MVEAVSPWRVVHSRGERRSAAEQGAAARNAGAGERVNSAGCIDTRMRRAEDAVQYSSELNDIDAFAHTKALE